MKRNVAIDLLKGIAIIAVVLYHWGISPYGYLGVDIFLVISGYLATMGLLKSFEAGQFSYWKDINKRLSRLWPGLILICIIALIFGYQWMLPLHLKLNCEAIIGTCCFGNNFVQYITSGNYWMADNEYKPLMHTWYVGVLMQFYLIIPLVFIVAKKFAKNWVLVSYYILACLSFLSFIVYISPLLTESQNFYLLPSRFFELGAGGLLAITMTQSDEKLNPMRLIIFLGLLCLALLFVFQSAIDSVKLRLIITAAVSIALVWNSNYICLNNLTKKLIYPITFMGVASYSLYLSHQVFFGLYRYAFDNEFSLFEHIRILGITVVIGIVFYFIFEKPISKYLSKEVKNIYKVNISCFILAIVLSSVSFCIYKSNGLVRDIPELDLYKGKNNQTPEDYNSRIFAFDKDFEKNGRKNILVIGDSFGRDWINILLEGGVDSVMNISYHTEPDGVLLQRLEDADFVFAANNAPINNKYSEIVPYLLKKKFYRVGIKGFGSWCGLVYNNNRSTTNYYHQTIKIAPHIIEIDSKEKKMFGDSYIDMMAPVKVDNRNIKMFTDDRKLVSQDCLHLTKAGAELYAKRLNVWEYLK